MNLSFLLAALSARRWLFLLILTATVLATLVVSLWLPKTYVAKVSLLMDGRDEQSLRTNAPISERERASYLQTQIDILTSPKVAYRVIRDLKLDKDAEIRGQFEASETSASFENWLNDRLLKQLKVDSSLSNVVQISYSSDDPDFAARLANGFAAAYIATTLELRVDPLRRTTAWFGEQLGLLRENMEQAGRRLADYQKQNGVISMDERYDADQNQFLELSNQLARTRIPGETAGGDSVLVGQSGSHLHNLRSDLIRAETKLRELSAELGGNHPQYQRKQSEVEALRLQLEQETAGAQAAAAQLARQARERRARLAMDVAAQRERVLDQKQARNQLAVLSSEATIAQRTYDAALQRFMASKIESQAVNTNVSIMDPALPPLQPARPVLSMNLALALVIGTLLGLTAVQLFEAADHRVRLIEDLEGDPQIPLLAVLSASDPPRRLGYPLLLAPNSSHALPGPG